MTGIELAGLDTRSHDASNLQKKLLTNMLLEAWSRWAGLMLLLWGTTYLTQTAAYQHNFMPRQSRLSSPLHLVVKSSSDPFSSLPDPQDENSSNVKRVILVSDSTGMTAQKTLNRAFSQFDSCSTLKKDDCELQVNVFSHVTNEETLAGLIRRAKDQSALMIYTLSDPELRSKSSKMCELSAVHSVDLMGPLLDGLSYFLEEAPLGTPGGDDKIQRQDPRKAVLSSSYYRRIEAVEFTLKGE